MARNVIEYVETLYPLCNVTAIRNAEVCRLHLLLILRRYKIQPLNIKVLPQEILSANEVLYCIHVGTDFRTSSTKNQHIVLQRILN
jgi:hypothetical protein